MKFSKILMSSVVHTSYQSAQLLEMLIILSGVSGNKPIIVRILCVMTIFYPKVNPCISRLLALYGVHNMLFQQKLHEVKINNQESCLPFLILRHLFQCF